MRSRSIIHRLFVLVVLLTVGLCFIEAGAQQRRNRRSRRVTNPVTRDASVQTTPATTTPDPTIISTADEQTSGGSATGSSGSGGRTSTRSGSSLEEEHDSMRNRMNRLSRQVTTLTEKLTKMEEQQRTLVDLERLSRAEQRAEGLRAQLRDVMTKEADLQARADQLEFELKPENIERTTANSGSTRPEEVRDARRRALENERARVRSQLELMSQSRMRLETAIATADSEAERIRQRLDETQGAPAQAGSSDNINNIEGTSNTETTVPTTTQPAGTPL
jgi:chromosome segregation ATPase